MTRRDLHIHIHSGKVRDGIDGFLVGEGSHRDNASRPGLDSFVEAIDRAAHEQGAKFIAVSNSDVQWKGNRGHKFFRMAPSDAALVVNKLRGMGWDVRTTGGV